MEPQLEADPRHDDSSNSESQPNGDLKQSPTPPRQFWMLSVSVCLGLFLSMIDTSIVATSLYSIGVEFKALNNVNWVALAYSLAYLGCAVAFSRVSDVVGRRDAFVAAYVLFLVFSLGCGFARGLGQLVALRALQGVGGSGLYSLAMIMLPELSPAHVQRYIGAMVGMVVTVAGVLGPVLGGLLTNYASWRWIFWINVPVGVISMTIFFLTWPKAEHLPPLQRRSWKELDYPGSILTVAASVLVVFAFQNAGTSTSGDAWSKAIFIASLSTGLACWALLFLWQHLLSRRFSNRFVPAFPVGLFRNRVFAAGAANTLLTGFPSLLLIYAVPLQIQVVRGKSALVAGVMLLPMLATTALGSVVSGRLNVGGRLSLELLMAGSALILLGCGLLTTLSGGLDEERLLGFLTFCGLGFGLTVSSSTMIAQREAPARDYAPAQGILAQLRILGGSLGISSSTAILGAKTSRYLAGILTPEHQASLGLADSQLSDAQWQAVRQTYLMAFRMDMFVATAVAGAALVITLGTYLLRRQRGVEVPVEEAESKGTQSPQSVAGV